MARDYSDTLRALGRILDEERATGVRVVDAGEHLSVSWQGREGSPQERGYRSFELDDLRVRARALRSAQEGMPTDGLSEVLRSVGWVLDQMKADLVTLTEDADGMRLVAIVNGRRASRSYSKDELASLVEAQREGRGRGIPPLAARALGPIPEEAV